MNTSGNRPVATINGRKYTYKELYAATQATRQGPSLRTITQRALTRAMLQQNNDPAAARRQVAQELGLTERQLTTRIHNMAIQVAKLPRYHPKERQYA